MGLFGGGDKTVTQKLAPADRRYVDTTRRQAQQWKRDIMGMQNPYAVGYGDAYQQGMAGLRGTNLRDFMAGNRQLVNNLGFATGFDPAEIEARRGSYMDQVGQSITDKYGQMTAQGVTDLKQQAAQASAFGGARHGVAEGAMRGQMNIGQGAEMAAAERDAYDRAMQSYQAAQGRAMQGGMAGLQGLLQGKQFGANINQALLGYGQQRREDQLNRNMWDVQKRQLGMNMLTQGMGPVGTSTMQGGGGGGVGGFLGGAAGGAMAGSAFGPIGAGVGGLIGGIGSLF
jgi:hypothetical protein